MVVFLIDYEELFLFINYLKKMGLVFKINFVHPFELNDYLVPNMYDWYISPEEIVYDRRKSSPVVRLNRII